MRNSARKPLIALSAAAAITVSAGAGIAAASVPSAPPARACLFTARISQTVKPVTRVQVVFRAAGERQALTEANAVAAKFGTYADVTALGCRKVHAVERLPWRVVCQQGRVKLVIDRVIGGVLQPVWAYCLRA